MAFIDDLALELFLLSPVGVIAVYMTAFVFFQYKKTGTKDIENNLRPGAFPLWRLEL